MTVVHIDRAGRTRLISARQASRKERALYHVEV
ncbi:BrnT family toxin [Palleronia caenipelagi]|uniref:BrnT family toxin n=1 Tax=Palleronia caenipelagi TaxID=2489174 RepID=A0A547PMV7_9RHOB|nr:BrnT family toxin [Palleronia caenipelagi]